MLYFCVSNERKAIGLQMDKFSFLNAAHTAYFAGLYDQYLTDPDSVEPSWRAFFQGYDFGTEQYGLENQLTEGCDSSNSRESPKRISGCKID